MINFNSISANILTPGQYVEFDNSRAVKGLPVVPHKILIIAPRLPTGTLAALTPTRMNSAAQGEAAMGRGSIGSAMIAAAKKANPYTDLYAIGVDENAAGVLATGTLTFTGPATAPGTLQVYIGGKVVSVAVASGDTAIQVAANFVTAVTADTSLPVTAAAGANPNQHIVTLTARYKGETGTAIDLRLNYNESDATPTGLAVAIVAMANGATNPVMATTLAALGDVQYHTIITPFTDSTSVAAIEAFLLDGWGGMTMKEGQAFGALYGTHSGCATILSARNSPFSTLMPTQKSPTPPWVFASALGAIDAGQAQSPADCNRPRQTLVLTGCLPPKTTDRYTRTERNTHLADGGATFVVDDGGLCRIERVVTTYKTSNGVPDASYQDVEDMRCLAYLRFSLRARIALRFPRHKLADDGTQIPPGAAIATPKVVRDEVIALALEWEDAGLVENIAQFKTDLIVERNASDPNRIDSILPPDLINGFRVFAGQIQFIR